MILSEPKKNFVGDALIIDDDPAICEILKEYCEDLGVFKSIQVAHDGTLASSKLRNQKFRIIIVDMKVPKKSGLDIIRELDDKTLNRRTNVAIVSGNIDKTTLEKAVGLGIKVFIPKPFEENVFKEKITKMLEVK